MAGPIAGSYRVAEGFLAGGYPGAANVTDCGARVRSLEDFGVTHFVDLSHVDDGLEPYEALLSAGVVRLSRPIADFGTVSPAELTALLDEIDDVRGAGGSVYLHCWGGIGRTGTVVGCWLRRHGLDGGDALARLAVLRAGVGDGRRSPETDAQRALVESWPPGR